MKLLNLVLLWDFRIRKCPKSELFSVPKNVVMTNFWTIDFTLQQRQMGYRVGGQRLARNPPPPNRTILHPNQPNSMFKVSCTLAVTLFSKKNAPLFPLPSPYQEIQLPPLSTFSLILVKYISSQSQWSESSDHCLLPW